MVPPPPGHARRVMGVNTMMYSTTAAPAFISGTFTSEGVPEPIQKEKKP
jgi:hypothetical protein